MYAGYELFEHVAVKPGSEEYLDSEKYQIRIRDWDAAAAEGRTLAPYLTRLNEIRRAHPALQRLRNVHIHGADDENILVFSKTTRLPTAAGEDPDEDTVIVVINLDPHATRETTVHLDLPALGLRLARHVRGPRRDHRARAGPGASTTTCASTRTTNPPTC